MELIVECSQCKKCFSRSHGSKTANEITRTSFPPGAGPMSLFNSLGIMRHFPIWHQLVD